MRIHLLLALALIVAGLLMARIAILGAVMPG
jgi:hypothetical protein